MSASKFFKMNTMFFLAEFLISIVKITSIVAISWLLIRKDIRGFILLRGTDHVKQPVSDPLVKEERSTLIALRLQAHERLIVFIERLNPANLLIRLHQSGMTAKDLQSVILNEVRNEYQHNVTQQLYISSDNWTILGKLKDDTLAMINNAVAGLPADATGVDLSRKVLAHLANLKDDPYMLTLELLKKDIHQLF